MKTKLILITVCSSVFFFSCNKSSTTPPSGGGGSVDCNTVKFSSSVLPLITSKCATAGCHDAASSNGPGPLISYASIFASRNSILSAVTANRMPQGGPPLSSQEKSILNCWIDAGAPNN
jgi:hypothetical protein